MKRAGGMEKIVAKEVTNLLKFVQHEQITEELEQGTLYTIENAKALCYSLLDLPDHHDGPYFTKI